MEKFGLIRQAGTQYSDLTVISQVAMLSDIPMKHSRLDDLESHAGALSSNNELWVPAGTVEFVRKAIEILGLIEPQNMSYPIALRKYLHREIQQEQVHVIKQPSFVKPVGTKKFTGFVYDPDATDSLLSEHDLEQKRAMLALGGEEPVWVSEVVHWASEYRYYILNQQVAGVGRYDDGLEESPQPDEATVQAMVQAWAVSGEMPCACSIDVGVLANGTTALVECNDAWALGFYKGTLKPESYVRMLAQRWAEIREF